MSHDDLIGRTLSKYVLIERIGAGGMASVYRAEAPGENQHVAIKVLPFHLAAKDAIRQRFDREARMAAKLVHPHILPIYEYGTEGDAPYIVMKLADRGTLNDLIERKGPLPLLFVARVMTQISAALDYAHDEGVIHRDIKPENIFFDRKGMAYLGDFGIARFHEVSASLTGSGGFIGTAAYASPEQCRGEELTVKSDIYSLGVVLFEMLTGKQPFEGGSGLAIIHQHISEPVPNPLKYRQLPLAINDVLRKALAKMPEVRYQTATSMSNALKQALRNELGTKPLAENAPPKGPDPVFEKKAASNTAPLPMPERYLAEFEATRPKPPEALQLAINPQGAWDAVNEVRAVGGTERAERNRGYVVFFLAAVVLVVVAVAALLLVS